MVLFCFKSKFTFLEVYMASSKKIAASIGGIIVFVLGVIAFVAAPMITDRG